VVKEIIRKKPSDAKADFVVSIALSSTMGPGVRVNVKDLMASV
jgi:large subunit ribosomal protein L1